MAENTPPPADYEKDVLGWVAWQRARLIEKLIVAIDTNPEPNPAGIARALLADLERMDASNYPSVAEAATVDPTP